MGSSSFSLDNNWNDPLDGSAGNTSRPDQGV
jgi:hypothetical protein